MTTLYQLRSSALILIFFSFLLAANAQSPEAIPYQAVARNNSGNLLQNQPVGLRFSIRDGGPLGAVVYQETHSVVTNTLGLFNVNIGQGSVVTGTFGAIDWGGGSKFTQVELDPAGGTAYVDMGTVQMLSVPYALYAETSGSAATENDPQVGSSTTNRVPKWNGTTLTDGLLYDNGTNIGIGTTSPSYLLHVRGTDNNIMRVSSSSTTGTWLSMQNISTAGRNWNIVSTGENSGEGVGKLLFFDLQEGPRMTIDGSGNVGIGTYSPDARLHLNTSLPTTIKAQSSNALGAWLTLSNTTTGGKDWNLISTGNASPDDAGNLWFRDNSTVRMAIQASTGNVGIGTTAPGEKLDVVGTTKTVGFQMPTGAANSYVLQSDAAGNASWASPSAVFTDTDDQSLSLNGASLSIDNGNSVDLSGLADNLGNHTASQNLQTNGHWLSHDGGDEGVFVKPDGKVGIGTDNPATELQIKDGDTPTIRLEQNGGSFSPYTWDIGANEANFFVRDLTYGGDKLPFRIFPGSSTNRLTINGNNVGIGTNSPAALLDVNGLAKTANFQMTSGAANGYVLQSDASGNALWVAPSGLSITETDPEVSASTTNKVPKWNGTSLTDGLMYDDGTNVGIGTSAPSSLLHVADGNFVVSGTYTNGPSLPISGSGERMFFYPKKGAFRAGGVYFDRWDDSNIGDYSFASGLSTMASGVGSFAVGVVTTASGNFSTALGHFSTASGNYSTALGSRASTNGFTGSLTLADLPNAFQTFSSTAANQFSARYKGGYRFFTDDAETESGTLFFSGGKLGIGISTPDEKLEVNGKLKTSTFQMTNGAASGYILQSDASGNASWINATSLTIIETDPQVSSATTSRVPRWTGTTLSDGTLFDDGTNVGIGTNSPSQKLDVSGTTKTTNFQMTNGGANGHILQSDASGNASWVNPTTLSVAIASRIQDSDADTKIQVEESSDEDKIRFDLAGTEKWVMTGSRLEPSNTGGSTFIGSNAGASDDLSTNNNVGIGHFALASNTSGDYNIAVGYVSLNRNISGIENTIVGAESGNSNTTGNGNAAFGTFALKQNTEGDNNSAFGYGSLSFNQTGNYNLALGSFAGNSNTSGSGNVFLGYAAGFDETGSDKLYIDNSNTSSPLIWGDFSSNYVNVNGNLGIGTTSPVNKLDVEGGVAIGSTYSGTSSAPTNGAIIEGRVGIGTTSPSFAKLVVDGSVSVAFSNGYGFLNRNGAGTTDNDDVHNYSIYATDRVAGTEFNAHSDARIKKIRGRSDNTADLETLMQLQITDYTLIDTVTKGAKPYKKVIAQEVEQVYPQAVSTIPGVAVPDIYQLTGIENGFVALANSGLKPGERVKLIFGEKQEVTTVIAITKNGFQTDLTAETGPVFVFGREVSDFRTVDYEALSMLNVSATQALVKQVTELQQQKTALENRLSRQEGKLNKLQEQMTALEAFVKGKPGN